MKEYQKTKEEVKGSIQILDEEAILETAAQGLKNLWDTEIRILYGNKTKGSRVAGCSV